MEEVLTILIDAGGAVTCGLLVYLLGVELTRRVAFLREFNIPEPVSGGVLVSLVTLALFAWFNLEVTFDLIVRDYFLVMFFTTIGMNARLADLKKGGKPLALLLVLTIVLIVVQNVIGRLGAVAFGFPGAFGPLFGSAALIGGHGTVLAWSPTIADMSGVSGVEELGVAVATLGLVLAALIGGPIARLLIERNKLEPEADAEEDIVGHGHDEAREIKLDHVTLMRTILLLHIAIGIGLSLQEGLSAVGLDLPLFVPSMLMGILVGNLQARFAPADLRVQRTPSLATVSDFALGTFLAMSLMSMQLWTLAGSGTALAVILAAQVAFTLFYAVFVVFRVMGRSYFAAVLSAGFGGFALGATPTAIANMSAVTKNYGPAPLAFIVLPLVAAFFVDLVNVAAINFFLSF
ncbi:MAG: sodium/glutamate symporter [Pseudomonadota bacterium]